MFMSSNFHPNAGHGHGQRPPLPNHRRNPPPPNNKTRDHSSQMAPFPGWGRVNNSGRGDTNFHGPRQNNDANPYPHNMGPPSNQSAFSHFSLGPNRNGMGDNGPTHPRNNFGSAAQMNRANEFRFKHSPPNRWNGPPPQQQQHHPHNQDFPGRPYNQKVAPRAPPHSHNSHNMPSNNNSNTRSNYSGHGQQKQQQRRPVAVPPPPPPLPEEYLKNKKRSRCDREREAARDAKPPKKREKGDAPKPAKKREDGDAPKPAKKREDVDAPMPPKKREEREAWRDDAPKPPAPNPRAVKKTKESISQKERTAAVNPINIEKERRLRQEKERRLWQEKERRRRLEKERRRRRRLNEKNKKNECGNGRSSSSQLVVVRDGREWANALIEAENAPLSKKQKSDGHKEFHLVSDRKEELKFDFVSNPINFPPLAPKPQGGDEAACPVALEEMSTSQLKLPIAAQASKIQRDDEDEEMDISDDEEEMVDGSRSSEGKQQKLEESGEAGQDNFFDLTKEPVVDLAGAASDSEAPLKVVSDTVTPEQQDLERTEKEKHALKLAELRAKAKLARAKLRIAERKKARGDVVGKEDVASVYHHRPVSTSPTPHRVPDITVGSLVIEDVALTGSPDEVRFVESVYKFPSCGGQADPVHDAKVISIPRSAGLSPNEEKRKKSETLKQKLQLARLQLEMKKKEFEKRKSLSPEGHNKANVFSTQYELSELKNSKEETEDQTHAMPVNDQDKQSDLGNDSGEDVLEQLRRRQKELKQKNDVANLRNLTHRQRDLLRVQSKELSESSMQLQTCVDSIASKQNLLDESTQRLKEMHHRKRIVEGMVFRATEQLIAARKVLSERRH